MNEVREKMANGELMRIEKESDDLVCEVIFFLMVETELFCVVFNFLSIDVFAISFPPFSFLLFSSLLFFTPSLTFVYFQVPSANSSVSLKKFATDLFLPKPLPLGSVILFFSLSSFHSASPPSIDFSYWRWFFPLLC